MIRHEKRKSSFNKSACTKPVTSNIKKGLNEDYIQTKVELDEIESFRSQHGGFSFTEIPEIRIDVYPTEGILYILSNKNKLGIKLALTEKNISRGFKIHNIRVNSNKLFIFLETTEKESGKSIVVKKAIIVDSIIIKNNYIEAVA